ncbi:MAG: M43 family zinc metalloprotease, partial [Bacteroidota bacterium]
MLYLPYFMVFLLCIPLSSVAQTPCLSRLQHNSDEAIEEVQAWLRATPTTDKSDVLSIPVVIHIVWHESVENISDEQIYTQMEVLNDAFRAQLAEANNVLDIFRDLVTDTKITFCLVQRDPHAQATDGIVRIRVSDPAIVRDKAALFDASPLWNPRSYLNIYVVNLAESVDGEATFPSDATASDDAILINYRSFGTNGTALLNPSRDGGKSLVHEVGHYLGLRHIWGSQEGCTFDDFEGEDDTPLQSRSYLGRCPNGVQTSCGT